MAQRITTSASNPLKDWIVPIRTFPCSASSRSVLISLFLLFHELLQPQPIMVQLVRRQDDDVSREDPLLARKIGEKLLQHSGQLVDGLVGQ